MIKISVIIPTFNEAENIAATLTALQPLRQQGHELIVADGSSGDGTVAQAEALVDCLINSKRGRAMQMNSGALHATGDVLLFLHADTLLPTNAALLIDAALVNNSWGRFDVQLSGAHPMLRLIGFMMNWRSRLSGICTGDQALFVRRELFNEIGGFPEIALMEDIAISTRLKHRSRPACIATKAVTSSRRWERRGILRTLFLMWHLRLAYFCGADPQRLATIYQRG